MTALNDHCIDQFIQFQGAYDYCSGLGGVLPSFNFFDVFNNINETPRKSINTTKETGAGARPFVSSNSFGHDSSEFEVKTKMDFRMKS